MNTEKMKTVTQKQCQNTAWTWSMDKNTGKQIYIAFKETTLLQMSQAFHLPLHYVNDFVNHGIDTPLDLLKSMNAGWFDTQPGYGCKKRAVVSNAFTRWYLYTLEVIAKAKIVPRDYNKWGIVETGVNIMFIRQHDEFIRE